MGQRGEESDRRRPDGTRSSIHMCLIDQRNTRVLPTAVPSMLSVGELIILTIYYYTIYTNLNSFNKHWTLECCKCFYIYRKTTYALIHLDKNCCKECVIVTIKDCFQFNLFV